MKINYKSPLGVSVEIESDSARDAVEQLAAFQEVFGEACGKCGSKDVQFVVRTAQDKSGDDVQYYELRCRDCGAKLAFGCNKKGGGLFPKRKDADGEWFNDRGWVKWNKETQKEE